MATKFIIFKVPNQSADPPYITSLGGIPQGGWSYGTIEEEDLIRLDADTWNIQELTSEESSSIRWYGCVRGYQDVGLNRGSDSTVPEEDKVYMPNEITGSVILFMKKIRKLQVENHYDKKFKLLNVQNLSGEKSTWEQQYNEASSYTQNTGSATPMLSLLAQKRGITVGTLAQNVISKRDTYVSASTDILGSQQTERDNIDSLTTIARLRKYYISGSLVS
jgi:hypothetical protein